MAAYGFEQYLADKQAMAETANPVEDLRRGWDAHIDFGLSRPAFYVLMYGDALPGKVSPAQDAAAILQRMLGRLAESGRLRMSVERAVHLVSATGRGVVMELISVPPDERDLELPAIVREATLQAIVAPVRPDLVFPEAKVAVDLSSRAVALRSALDQQPLPALTKGERSLLVEWLDRIADTPAPGGQD